MEVNFTMFLDKLHVMQGTGFNLRDGGLKKIAESAKKKFESTMKIAARKSELMRVS